MDQESFRRLLATQSATGATKHANQSFQKSRGSLFPSTSTSKTVSASEPAFKPRKLKKADEGADKYRNRAAERRDGQGNDYAQVEAILTDLERRQGPNRPVTDEQRRLLGGDGEHSILVKGLDMALLAQNKAKAASSAAVDDESLEQAYNHVSEPSTAPATTGKKRTRDDIIRELKEKKGGNTASQPQNALDSKFKPIGFKPIGSTDDKRKKKGLEGDKDRKKKKRKVEAETTKPELSQTTSTLPPKTDVPSLPPPEEDPDDDFDIFSGVAEYRGLDDNDMADEDKTTTDEVLLPPPGARGWFDDGPQEEETSIPPASTKPPIEPIPPPHEPDIDEEEQPMRLVPLASSAMPSIRDFLSMGEESGSKKKKKGKKKKKAGKGDNDDDED